MGGVQGPTEAANRPNRGREQAKLEMLYRRNV